MKSYFRSLSKDHVILTIIFISISIVLFLCWLLRDSPEIFDGGDEVYDYIVNISIGFMVTYVFYYINIFMPQKKRVLVSCNYIGDCMAYVAYNLLQLSDIFNKPNGEISVSFLTTRGQSFRYATGFNFSESQQGSNDFYSNYKSSNLQLRQRAYEHIRLNMPHIENAFETIFYGALGVEPFDDSRTTWTNSREQKLESLRMYKKEYKTFQINIIMERFVQKLEFLVENEKQLNEFELSIIQGDNVFSKRQKV